MLKRKILCYLGIFIHQPVKSALSCQVLWGCVCSVALRVQFFLVVSLLIFFLKPCIVLSCGLLTASQRFLVLLAEPEVTQAEPFHGAVGVKVLNEELLHDFLAELSLLLTSILSVLAEQLLVDLLR